MGNVTAGQLLVGGAIAYFLSNNMKESKADESDAPKTLIDESTTQVAPEPEKTVEPEHESETLATSSENISE